MAQASRLCLLVRPQPPLAPSRPVPSGVFTLEVQAAFSAAHALRFVGPPPVTEPLHGHDWHVTACIAGEALDADGLLVDFHAVEAALRAIVQPFHNRTLNDVPPFDRTNPSAEHVARHIAQQLQVWLETRTSPRPKTLSGISGVSGTLPPVADLRVAWVRTTEAIGCAATYRPT